MRLIEPKAVWKREYEKHYNRPHWQKVRCEALKRSEGKCERCEREISRRDPTPRVHHLTYERIGKELVDDVLVVCSKCHGELHMPPLDPDEQDDDWLNLDRWPALWPAEDPA